MRIAFVGCGFVADYYMTTLTNHPQLELVGVYDINPERQRAFSQYHHVATYNTFEELLADDNVDIVVNLTNPDSHYEVSKAALAANKHVYSEKPLAMDYENAKELVELAKQKGLHIAAAPCNFLSETAQTVWKALRENKIGTVRLAYAELDGGLIPRMAYDKWVSASGAPWNAKDEFESGCTVEHAGYYLTWLTMFFGPAKSVTSFATVLMPDKGIALDRDTPDYTSGCIEFHSGVVARMTNSIIADHDHNLTITGDGGLIKVEDGWYYHCQVYTQKRRMHTRLAELPLVYNLLGHGPRKYRMLTNTNPHYKRKGRFQRIMDYCRGIAEMALAIEKQQPGRVTADHALHITEITLALQYPETMGCPRQIESTFDPIEPMDWAK